MLYRDGQMCPKDGDVALLVLPATLGRSRAFSQRLQRGGPVPRFCPAAFESPDFPLLVAQGWQRAVLNECFSAKQDMGQKTHYNVWNMSDLED